MKYSKPTSKGKAMDAILKVVSKGKKVKGGKC